jgi:site-specific recombinase
LKLIPSEIVATYMAVAGLWAGGIMFGDADITSLVAWIVFGFLLVMTPVYLRMVHKVPEVLQIVFTTLSFAVWVYWLGGPFELAGWHQPQLASIGLALWTLLMPLVPVRRG